ncbi:hypothetical protein DENSPDRAFT_886941 [Dentipellis sp. KUC8613]|nr:hypothetical protein DENSPDRAFT_886941 [Dentipellis sp. KUC8613]
MAHSLCTPPAPPPLPPPLPPPPPPPPQPGACCTPPHTTAPAPPCALALALASLLSPCSAQGTLAPVHSWHSPPFPAAAAAAAAAVIAFARRRLLARPPLVFASLPAPVYALADPSPRADNARCCQFGSCTLDTPRPLPLLLLPPLGAGCFHLPAHPPAPPLAPIPALADPSFA